MNKKEKVGCMYSWPMIIAMLCIFWPVGIYLLVKRMSFDKKASISAGKLIFAFSVFSYFIAIVGFLSCFDDGYGSDDITMILFFGIAGFALQKVSQKIKKNAENVKRYLAVIVNGNERNIDVIAASLGKTYDESKADIQKLIDKGYLKNAYINETAHQLTLPGDSVVQTDFSSGQTTQNHEKKVVACPCCGANNTITGDMGECEYCGSPLR